MTRVLTALVGALVAAPVLAQSPDPAFLSQWTWSPETFASEATGLGGAFVATVRGADALFWSPAALTFDSGLDVRASIGVRPGLGAVLHGESLHLGFAFRRTFSRTRRGDGYDPTANVFEVGSLAIMLDQAAVGAGFRAGRLRVGATLIAGPLKVDGAWSRVVASTSSQPLTEVRYDYTGRSEWQVGAASSAIFEVLGTHPMARDQVRIGVALRWPSLGPTPRYRRSRLVLRGASVIAPETPSFEGTGPTSHAFHLPATASVGAEARVSVFAPLLRGLRAAIGADWTDYDDVLDTAHANGLDAATRLSFDRRRAWELGGGLEAVLPLLRVRLGLRERANHNLVIGPSVQPGQLNATFGVSRDIVIGGKRLLFDFDAANSFDNVVLSGRLLW